MAKKNDTGIPGTISQNTPIDSIATDFIKEGYTPYVPGSDFNMQAALSQYDLKEDVISPFQDNWMNVPQKYGAGKAFSALNADSIRGENQSGFKRIVNGLVGNTMSIATKIGRGMSETLGLGYGAFMAAHDPQRQMEFASKVGMRMSGIDTAPLYPEQYENFLIKFFDYVEDDLIKETLLPVSPNLKYNKGDLASQMGTINFWANDVADAVAFALSAMAPVTAINKAFKAVKMSEKALKMANILASGGYNTLTEATLEGKEIGDNIARELSRSVYGAEYDYLTEEQRKDIDIKAAPYKVNAFQGNLGILGISNLVQARFFVGPVNTSGKKIMRGIRSGKLKPEDIKIAKKVLLESSMGIPSEALWEEGLQNAIQEYETSLATGEAFMDNKIGGYAYEWLRGFYTDEGQKSMMLGALIGGGMGAYSGMRDARQDRQFATEYKDQYDKALGKLKTYANSLVPNIKHFYKEFEIEEKDENGEIVTRRGLLDENGNTQIDIDKMMKLFMSNASNKRIFDNLMMSAVNSDPVYQKFIENEALQRMFFNYITSTVFEDTNSAYNALLNDSGIKEIIEDGDLKDLGIDFSDIKMALDTMKSTWDDVENKLFDRDDIYADEETMKFKEFLTQGLFYERNKMAVLDSVEEFVKDKEQLDTIRDETQEMIDLFEDTSKHKELFKRYRQQMNEVIGLAAKYNEESKKDPGSLETKKAKYLYEEASTINGIPESNSEFSILSKPEEKTGELGIKNQHYLDIGVDSITGARLEAEIEAVREGRSSLDNVISILDNPVMGSLNVRGKMDISMDDIAAVREIVPIEKKRLDESEYTPDQRDRDINNIDAAVQEGEIKPEDGIQQKKEINEKFTAMRIARDNFNKALTRLDEIEQFANGEGLLNYRDGIPKKIDNDYVFQRKVADKPVNEADEIEKTYSANPEMYDNLRKVERVIDELQARKEIYQNTELKDRLERKAFKGYIESIDKSIKTLTVSVMPEVKKNFEEKKNIDTQSQVNRNSKRLLGLGIELDEKGEIKVQEENRDLYKLISDAIGASTLDAILEDAREAAEMGNVYSFHEVFVDRILVEIKNSDLKTDVLEKMKGRSETLKKKLGDAYIERPDIDPQTLKNRKKAFTQYSQNPKKGFKDILVSVMGVKTEKGIFAFDIYRKDNDINKYHNAIQEEKQSGYNGWTNNEIIRLTSLHLQIEGMNEAIGQLESRYDPVNHINDEYSHYLDIKLAPTNQQIAAIRGAVKWYNSTVKTVTRKDSRYHRFKNWAFLKGIAGSGKTQIVIGYITRSLRLKSDEVFAIAPHNGSAAMLNESLSLAIKPKLAQELKEDSIPQSAKLVVVDEVAALTDTELVTLANTLQKANEGRDQKFKVISLGDPSQVQKKQPGMTMSEEPEINRNVIDGINMVEVIDPLTIAHRSLIDENNEFMDSFNDNDSQVTGLTAYARDKIGFDTVGVHVGDNSHMNQQLESTKGNGKTKAIIVYSDQDKLSFINRHPDLKDNTFTYAEVAGREFDQVFIDLNRDQFLDDSEFNEAMYTAISRNKEYAFVVDHTRTFNNKQKNLSFNTEDRNKVNAERRNEYEKRIEFEKSILKGKTVSDVREGRIEQEDKAEEVIGSETEDRYEDPETDDTTGQEEEDVYDSKDKIYTPIDNAETAHDLKYPSHVASKFIGKKGLSARLIEEGDVIYVKAEDPTGKMPYAIHVLGQLYDKDKKPLGNRFAHLGIMSEDEIYSSFGEELMKNAEAAYREKTEGQQAELFNVVKIDRTNDIAELQYYPGQKESHSEIYQKTVLSSGRLKVAQPLAYKYEEKVTHTGSGMLEKLMDLFNHKFLARANEKANYRVEIFYKKNKPEGKGRYAGVPYLVIEPTSSRGRQKNTQYIRLNPSKIDQDNERIIHLRDFRDAVKKLMDHTGSRLGDRAFNNMIHLFSRNYHIVGKNVEFKGKELTYQEYKARADKGFVPQLSMSKFNGITEFMTPVIEGIYGPGQIKRTFVNEQEMKETYALDENNENDDSRYEFVKAKDKTYGYALRYSKENPEAKGVYEYGIGLKSGAGKAQVAINVLAKANKYIGNKNIRVRTRKMRDYAGEKLDNSVKIITGKSLTASDINNDGYYSHLRNLAKDNEIDLEIQLPNEQGKETTYVIKYVTDDTVETVENMLVEKGVITPEKLEQLRSDHITEPIRIEDLNNIVDDFKGGKHAELRTPLKIYDFNKLGEDINKNRAELDDLLETNLSDILPTQIVVQPESNKSTKTVEPKKETPDEDTSKAVTDIGKRLSNKIKGIRKKPKQLTSEQKTELGKSRSERYIRNKIKASIPNISDKEIKFMSKMAIDKIMGKPSWGLFKDGVIYLAQDKDGNTYENIARHEVFHKIWNEYLTPKEREDIEKLAKEEFKDHSKFIDIEELLANKYHQWRRGTLKKIGDKIRLFFNRMLRILTGYQRNINNIEQLFIRIENGFYDKKMADGDVIGTRAMRDIVKKYGNVNNYIVCYSEMIRLLKKYRSPVSEGKPMTILEAMRAVKTELESKLAEETAAYNRGEGNLHTVDVFNLLVDNYEEVINDIFPKKNIFKEGIYLSDLEQDFLKRWSEDRKPVNLTDHIIENSMVNTEQTVTEEVKEFLSYVENKEKEIKEDDYKEFLTWRYVYVKILGLFEGLSFEQDNFMDQIVDSFRTKSRTDNEDAILNHISELIDVIKTNNVEGEKVPDTMKFLDNDTFVVSRESVSDIDGREHPMVRNKTAWLIEKGAVESTDNFITRIAREVKLSDEIISHYMRQNYATIMLSRLVSHFNSHRQRTPMIGERKSSYGGYEVSYINARGTAVSNGVESVIKTAIEDNFQDAKSVSDFYKKTIPAWKRDYDTSTEFVKRFLREIGLKDYAVSLGDKGMDMIVDDIENFFDRAKDVIDKPLPKSDETMVPEEYANPDNTISDTYTMSIILLNDGGSMLNRITSKIMLLDDLSRILSSNDVKGNRRYNAVLTSQAHKNIFSIINNKFKTIDEGKIKRLDLRKIYESKYFENNIFIKGINKIYNIVDHDGHTLVTYKGETIPIEYNSERRKEFNFRSFVLGFLKHAYTTGKKTRYIQYIYPNERGTPYGLEVDVLNRDRLLNAIESTIEQLLYTNEEAIGKYQNYDKNRLIGFEVLREVIGDKKDVSEITKEEISGLALKVYNRLNERSKRLTDVLIKDETELFSTVNKGKIYNHIDKEIYKDYSPKYFDVNNGNFVKIYETWDDVARRTGKTIEEAKRDKERRRYKITPEDIQPLVSLFYINNYVNGYHYSQLVAGDHAAFKDTNDLIKRLSIAFAPGKAGFVNKTYGMKEKARIAIINDPVEGTDDIRTFLNDLIGDEKAVDRIIKLYPDEYEPTDGQGFALPERFDNIEKGFGESYGNVLKPVIWSIDETGSPVSVKYSLVKLSNELCDKHPELNMLREKMRNSNIDEAVFTSATKVGKPITRNQWSEIVSNDPEVSKEFSPESILTIDNRDYRIQLDPAADLESSVANPMQLSYIMRFFGKNEKQAQDIYNSMSEIIKLNHDSFSGFVSSQFNTFIRSLTERKGQEMLNNLMSEGVSYNFPSMVDRMLIQFISSIYHKSIEVRYPGSKFVLQTAQGTEKGYGDKVLRYGKDSKGGLYAEVIVPRGFLPKDVESYIQDSLDNNQEPENIFFAQGKESKDILGFRIPSSELHSAVALKIVGFYDSQGTNVIIAPKELVPIHGSDFDVDSLFVVKRKLDKNYSDKIPVGYRREGDTYTFIESKELFLDTLSEDLDNKQSNKLLEAYHMNRIIENYLSIITDPANLERMLSPISFIEMQNEKDRVVKITGQDDVTYDPSDIVDAQKIHNIVFGGEKAIGMFMNMMKSFGFLHKSTKGHPVTKIKEEYNTLENGDEVDVTPIISFNGDKFQEIGDITKDNKEVGYRFDSLVNSALDNLKLQILPFLNVSSSTIRAYSVLVMHGVPIRTINNFISQPILKYLTQNGTYKYDGLVNRISSMISSDEIVKIDSLYDDRLESYLGEDVDQLNEIVDKDNLTEKEINYLVYQAKVAQQFKVLNSLGDSVNKVGQLANVLKTLPIEVAEIDSILLSSYDMFGINNMSEQYDAEKSTFPYMLDTFFESNPHLKEILKVLEWTSGKIKSKFIKYSPAFRKITNKLVRRTGIKLDNDSTLSKKKITDEFVKYLLSMMVDRSAIDPYYWTDRKGKIHRSTGVRAFNRRFVSFVKRAKQADYDRKRRETDYHGNMFLNALNISKDPITQKEKIFFHGPSGMDAMDYNLFRKSFDELNTIEFTKKKNGTYKMLTGVEDVEYTNFQKMFVTYAMINYGMNFGLRNYSVILPGELYRDISNKFVKNMNRVKDMNEVDIANMLNHFENQLIVNNPESMPDAPGKAIATGEKTIKDRRGKEKIISTYHGEENGIYYDRKFASETQKAWPSFYKEGYNQKIDIYQRVSDLEDSKAYYVYVGRKDRDGIYDIDSLEEAIKYNRDEAYNSRVRHINGTVTKAGMLNVVRYELKKGDIISVSENSDPAKSMAVNYRVTDKVTADSYRVEELPQFKEAKYFRKPGSEAERMANEIYDILRKRAEPFRAGAKGKVYYLKHRANEGKERRIALNNEYFSGRSVIKDRMTQKGWEVYVDMDEMANYLYGSQAEMFREGLHKSIDSYVKDKTNKIVNSVELKKLSDETLMDDNKGLQAVNRYVDTYDNKSISEILSDIRGRSKNKFIRDMANLAMDKLKDYDIKYGGHKDLSSMDNADGIFYPTGEIYMDYIRAAYYFDNPFSIEAMDNLILHEMVHGFTYIQVNADSNFRSEIRRIMDEALQANPSLGKKYDYAFEDEAEFIAEFYSNRALYEDLTKIKDKTEGNKIIKFIKAILRKLGFAVDDSMAKRFDSFVKRKLRHYDYLIPTKDGKYKRYDPVSQQWKIENYSPALHKYYEQTKNLNTIVEQGRQYRVPEDDTGNEEDFYTGPNGERLRRITDIYNGFISLFRKKTPDKKKTFGEREADYHWKYVDKDAKQVVDIGVEETYNQHRERKDKIFLESVVKGKIVHKIIERWIDGMFNGGLNQGRIDAEIQNIAYSDHTITYSDGEVANINVSVDPAKFDWVNDKIDNILSVHGIDVKSTTAQELRDVLASEVVVASDLLGFAGTADIVIEHSDGKMSIKDVKTGYNFDNVLSTRLLKYGERRRNIYDSPRDRAKLQIMTYAFIMKLNNPDLQFRDLSVMWIPGRYHATNLDMVRKVDVDDFLDMIHLFLRDKNALKEAGIDENVYDKIVEKAPKIFNASEYTNEYTEAPEISTYNEKKIEGKLIQEMKFGDKTPEAMLEHKVNELKMIIGKAPVLTDLGKSKFEDLGYKDKIRARLLTHQILQLLQDPSTSFALDPDSDVRWVSSWLGNYSELNIPHVKIWKKFRDEMNHNFSLLHKAKMSEFQSIHKPVLEDYYKANPNMLRHKKFLNWNNYKDIYGFAYKEFNNNGSKQLRILHKGDSEYNKLTKNQQNLINFLNKEYASYFDEKNGYLNQTAVIRDEFDKQRRLSILELHNLEVSEGQKRKYYPGFFPKIPKEQSEVIYDIGKGSYLKGLMNKEFVRDMWHKSITYYEENQFEGRNMQGMVLPVRHLGSFAVDNKRDYSYNLEFQYDEFIKSIEYKRHMDPVYALGESVRGYLSMVKYKDQPMFTNAVDMFEKKLISDILSRTIRKSLSRKPILLSGNNLEDKEIRSDAVLNLMRNWVSATIMWLRPFQGGGNGLHATFLKHKDGLKGTLAAKLFGIKEDAIDYTLADSLYADSVYFTEHIVNAMTGNIQRDKTWLMLKKFDYMPDNFDFKSPEKYLLSTRNRMISRTSMYAFHRLPEEYVSMTTMIAQMKHMKHPTYKKNGKPVSLWDCYEVKKDPATGEYDVVWKEEAGSRGYFKRGTGINTQYVHMKELVPQEIAKLKKVYERMQGGYRKEEAAALEAYVMGKVFIQLKKYIPRLILNALQSKRGEMDLGKWQDTMEIREGEKVWEWVERVNDGRWRVLGLFMLNAISMGQWSHNYSWNQLEDEQKQHLIDAFLTLSAWAISYTGYMTMFGDDKDDDTLKKWWKMYLLDNLGQQYNPEEMLKLITQGLQPVAFVRAGKAMNNMVKFGVATWHMGWGHEEDKIFTDRDQIKGWYELKKSIPFIASYEDLMNKLKNAQSAPEWFFGDMQNKWR